MRRRFVSAALLTVAFAVCPPTARAQQNLGASASAAEAASSEPGPATGRLTPGADSLIAAPSAVVSDADLNALEASIEQIFRTRVDSHAMRGAAEVADLGRRADKAETSANAMVARLEPYEKIYQSFLALLGPAPGKGETDASPAITAQRDRLLKGRGDLSGRLMRARLYALEAHQLVVALGQRTDAAQQALLTQRFQSPLGAGFWGRLRGEFSADTGRALQLSNEIGESLVDATKRGRLTFFLVGIVAAAPLLCAPFALARQIRRAAARMLRDGKDRRLASALMLMLVSLACAMAACGVFWLGLTGGGDLDGTDLGSFADMVGAQLPMAAALLGVAAAILSPRQTEWRIAPLNDEAARALVPLAIWFATLPVLKGVLRYVDLASGLGSLGVQVLDAIFVFVAAPLLVMIPRAIVRSLPGEDGQDPDEAPGTLIELRTASIGRLVRTLATVVAVFCFLAVACGYIPLAYTTVSWLCSMAAALTVLGLIFMLTQNLGETVFVSSSSFGWRLTRLGVPHRVIDLGSVLATGLISVFLAFVAVAVAQSDGNFDLQQTTVNVGKLVIGPNIGGVTFSFDTVLICLVAPVAGHYVIKAFQVWLRTKLFPRTRLDLGAQTSIVSIFTYTAWILVGLSVLSSIGITVKSMTWVVSALSVGIGFGLQSIVQNFVSGIILLAERPVTIGDLVEIGGSVGDIKRISVRSTDIGLADGSTMIVPNSQFITSAVRNATLGHPTGSLSVAVDLPLGTDLVKAIGVMSAALAGVPDLLKTPAPTVSVSSISGKTVTLSASGRTQSPRNVGAVSNDARLAMWKELHANGVVASIPSSASEG
ncbi:mechanosensitive ion channel domain-containing protein [Acetobacter sp. DsW_063]|uniref:mechanosensitive ion channel domain-containing protein n=1 Tax=Acetobacter sp. DsW_063 TaxID=1514894 RepID=UPI001E28AECA|nr:mechanosensitive ion channel domain-containing protein [Acetobacter sp. DsW_063]